MSEPDRAEPSGAAVVTRGGKPVLAWAGGVADAARGDACTPATRFQVASVSKMFAASAVLLLADRGELRLDDPVTRWLPGSPATWNAVTVGHLLSHTSGLGHLDSLTDLDLFRPGGRENVLAAIQRAPMRSAPGSEWYYSTPGYVLLGWVVEATTGKRYPRFLAEEVFAPLGMGDTTADAVVPGEGVACGHHDGEPLPNLELTSFPGAGDAWSTVTDLARFVEGLRSGELLGEESTRQMLTLRSTLGAQQPADGWATYAGYGYGCYLGTLGGRPAAFHPGDVPGHLSLCARFDDGTGLVVLLNEDTTDLWAVCRQLLADAEGTGRDVGQPA